MTHQTHADTYVFIFFDMFFWSTIPQLTPRLSPWTLSIRLPLGRGLNREGERDRERYTIDIEMTDVVVFFSPSECASCIVVCLCLALVLCVIIIIPFCPNPFDSLLSFPHLSFLLFFFRFRRLSVHDRSFGLPPFTQNNASLHRARPQKHTNTNQTHQHQITGHLPPSRCGVPLSAAPSAAPWARRTVRWHSIDDATTSWRRRRGRIAAGHRACWRRRPHRQEHRRRPSCRAAMRSITIGGGYAVAQRVRIGDMLTCWRGAHANTHMRSFSVVELVGFGWISALCFASISLSLSNCLSGFPPPPP